MIAAISSNVWSVYKNNCSLWFEQNQDDSLNMIFLDCEVSLNLYLTILILKYKEKENMIIVILFQIYVYIY